MKTRGLTLTACLLWSASSLLSQSPDEIRAKAEQGDAAAQNDLGVMHVEGKGVAKDEAEAAKWYRKAAEQGNAAAQRNLGVMYDEGRGVERHRQDRSDPYACMTKVEEWRKTKPKR